MARLFTAFLGYALVFTLGAVAAPASVAKRQPAAAVAWQELRHCRLVSGKFADGDDFVLRHGDREHIFRLYWVDAPECSRQVPERVREQAAHFGIAESQVLELGQAAREFTARQLQGDVTVFTHWESALGTRARYYAIVTVGRRDLGVELVRQGLARRHGRVPGGLESNRRHRLEQDLESAEREARKNRRGAWGLALRESPRPQSAHRPPPGNPVPVDLNHASFEELTALPGIGPTLARRIIDARPFRTVDDLGRVRGVGARRMEALRSLVRVEDTPPSTKPSVRPNR